MREKEKVKMMKKVEEEDEEGEEEEERKEKSTHFFFSPLSSSCFSSIYSISIHCFLPCCLPSAREKENIFFFPYDVGSGLLQLNIVLSMGALCLYVLSFFIIWGP